MSFVDVETPNRAKRKLNPKVGYKVATTSFSCSQIASSHETKKEEEKEEEEKEQIKNNNKSTTFQFKELRTDGNPSVTSALFSIPWTCSHTEYLIISDSEEEEEEEEEEKEKIEFQTSGAQNTAAVAKHDNESVKDKHMEENKCNSLDGENTSSNEKLKDELTFLEKLTAFSKDIGHFFTSPGNNIREFLRRREGYLPPDKHFVNELSENDK